MSSDGYRDEIGVFISTSMCTRLALSVPPATTVALLFGEVERAHFNCLPSFGEIKVQGFMVKHKSCFYHLSPFVPLLSVLADGKGPCFLHATAAHKISFITMPSTYVHDVTLRDGCHFQPSGASDVECSLMTANKRNLDQKCQGNELNGLHCDPVVQASEVAEGKHNSGDTSMNLENSTSLSIGFAVSAIEKTSPEENFKVVMEDYFSSENSSATRSVTDIIRRHYSVTDILLESQCLPEGKLKASKLQFFAASPLSADMTPTPSGFFMLQDAGSGQLSNEGKRPDVGQRLLMASSKLGISPSNPSPLVSMYGSKKRKHLGANVYNRIPVFELSENSD